MPSRVNTEPSERRETVRQAIAGELEYDELTTAELSTRIGIREQQHATWWVRAPCRFERAAAVLGGIPV
jgi:hypothetical protein